MTVILMKFRSDAPGSDPAYDEYTIYDAVVRECFAVDPENENGGAVTVYYLDGKSKCVSPDGKITAMPKVKYGDMMLLYAGMPEEMRLRIAEAAYFPGGRLSHVRLKLK